MGEACWLIGQRNKWRRQQMKSTARRLQPARPKAFTAVKLRVSPSGTQKRRARRWKNFISKALIRERLFRRTLISWPLLLASRHKMRMHTLRRFAKRFCGWSSGLTNRCRKISRHRSQHDESP